MEISGRTDTPWTGMFIFHFLSKEGDQVVTDKLQALIARESASGLNFHSPVSAGKESSGCQIAGRFLAPAECTLLLANWNEPDGNIPFMCYTPNHGVATLRDGKLDWWALICFQCANAGIGDSEAVSTGSVPNRLLPQGPALQDSLIELLPERPFPVRL